VGSPRVAYREALTGAALGRGVVDRSETGPGGRAAFGDVQLELAPEEKAGARLVVAWDPDCQVPAEWRGAVAEALAACAGAGPRFGFPLEGLRVRLFGGSSRPGQDTESGFVQAATLAFADALARTPVALLEPVMRFEVSSPEEFAGGLLADLNAQGALIFDVESEGLLRILRGDVPLLRMFGYTTTLRSLSQGRAAMTLELGGFRPVPDDELAERGLIWT